MNKSMDLFKQLLETITDIKRNKNYNSHEVKRKFVELKKKFYILRQNQRTDSGQVREFITSELLSELLELRSQGYENEEDINEILQIIAEDAKEQGDIGKAKSIHTTILGYPGTNCTRMEPEYIHEIIYSKLDKMEDTSIGKDIISMVLEFFESPNLAANNMERYKNIIEDTIVPLVSEENKELTDKRIITVLSKISKEYKAEGNYQRASELCNYGVGLKQFEGSDEYKELAKETESLRLYLELEKNFRTVKIDLTEKTLIEAIREALGRNSVIDVETGGGDVFLKGTHGSGEERDTTSTSYQMSTEKKLEAIERLVKEIQQEIPTATVTEIKVNTNGTFDGYVIIPITNTNITVLENMNDDVNEAIYLAVNSKIEDIVGKMTKQEAKREEGVDSANHTEDYEAYSTRLIEKAKKLLEYPEKRAKREGVKRKSKAWYARFKNPLQEQEQQ